MSLQRSEQKGRQRLAGLYSAGLPHCGQETIRGLEVADSLMMDSKKPCLARRTENLTFAAVLPATQPPGTRTGHDRDDSVSRV